MSITESGLFRDQCWVGGDWVGSLSGEVIGVVNPSSGEEIGSVPWLGEEEIEVAIGCAEKGLVDWRKKTARERGDVLERWSNLMLQSGEELAEILTTEQGKPYAEALAEVSYGAGFLKWFGEEGRRVYGQVIPSEVAGNRVMVMKEGVGIVGAIVPWNFPVAMITRKVGAALAAGCCVIVKPSELTPFCAFALAELGRRAGVPDGVFQVVTGDAELIGDLFCKSEKIAKISFTGSTRVGKLLLGKCSETVKRVSLELGGHAPFIVFEDADIEDAVKGAMASKYRASGQTCICANRFYVHESVVDEFCERLVIATEALRLGDGMSNGVMIGPLINEDAFAKVERHVADAVDKGGQVLCGGQISGFGGTFYEPTVIKGVCEGMLIYEEETFGPVCGITVFGDEEEVLERANDTRYGLASYFYTRDFNRIWRMSERLAYGMVGVNTGVVSAVNVPFGGVKESGLGKEGGSLGIEEYLESKYVCIGGVV